MSDAFRTHTSGVPVDVHKNAKLTPAGRALLVARIARTGHRIHGYRCPKVEGVGWEFYHAAIDDASRVAYGEVRGSERKEDVTAFLVRVVAFFYTSRTNGKLERVIRTSAEE